MEAFPFNTTNQAQILNQALIISQDVKCTEKPDARCLQSLKQPCGYLVIS